MVFTNAYSCKAHGPGPHRAKTSSSPLNPSRFQAHAAMSAHATFQIAIPARTVNASENPNVFGTGSPPCLALKQPTSVVSALGRKRTLSRPSLVDEIRVVTTVAIQREYAALEEPLLFCTHQAG